MPRQNEQARIDAQRRDETRYISARPCPAGHIGPRFTISAACCTCNDVRRAKRLGIKHKETPHEARQRKHERHIEAGMKRFPQAPFAHALSEYAHSQQARDASRYLDNALKNYVASALKQVPHEKDI